MLPEIGRVRELRQNARQLLEYVQAGKSIEITHHGLPVAHLSPIAARRMTLAELVEAGLARPGHGDILDIEPIDPDLDASAILAELRAE